MAFGVEIQRLRELVATGTVTLDIFKGPNPHDWQ